jgi:carbon storage regulator
MLVLTRRINEEIIIDGNVRITITSIQGDKVRIGITAPDNVRVDRAEVHARRQDLADQPMIVPTSDSVTPGMPVNRIARPRTRQLPKASVPTQPR